MIREKLRQDIQNAQLPSYIYGYPSKRAYRKFDEPISKEEIWINAKGNLNLYIHIPFCKYKCSYCTLLSVGACEKSIKKDYLDKLIKEIEYCGKVLKGSKVESIYFGGGTPTILTKDEFKLIFDTLNKYFYNYSENVEIAVETSPDTVNSDILMFLKNLGVNRVSIGIQSFNKEELKSIKRPTSVEMINNALTIINECNFKNFNIDLIYGLEGQTQEGFLKNLAKALEFNPTSLNLYPIVIRETTDIYKDSLNKANKFIDNNDKYSIYDKSVSYLKENGYRQETFVSFTKLNSDGYVQQFSDFEGNSLIGFGVGARSYTDSIHYSSDYSEDDKNILNIIKEYSKRDIETKVYDGFILNESEKKVRYATLNLIVNRLNVKKYKDKFKSNVLEDFKEQFDALVAEECIEIIDNNIMLTAKGYKYSSLVGTLFYSENVERLTKEFIESNLEVLC